MSRRIAWCLIAIALLRVVSTYGTFNHTMDEPFFIACGLEWLDNRTYAYMPEQPPLSRITAALGAKLAGVRNVSAADFATKAPLILYDSPSYWRSLSFARAGQLPFLVLASIVVWLWTRRLHGERAALAALLLFTTMPVVLGHAGLATTDIAICAMLPAAVYAFILWLDDPSLKQSAWLAAAIAGGVLSKFSFLLFFAVSAAVVLWMRGRAPDWRPCARTLPAIAIASCAVIAAFYWFDPAPLIQGLKDLRQHNADGHPSYLFGERRTHGWWYFFPAVFVYKTPLAFLVLIVTGCFCLRRAPREQTIPLACAAAIMLSAMPSNINIGLRHILPVYPLLAITAGFAAVQTPRVAGGLLLLAQIAASAAAHPDYLAYFNELARGKPERVRVDSDLDWGQNFDRLAAHLRQRGIAGPLKICGFGCVIPGRHGLGQPEEASPFEPSTGWIAVSATERYMSDRKPPDGLKRRPWAWLSGHEPVERIGGGAMLLYYIPAE